MAIIVNLDVMLAKRKMRLSTVAEEVGITIQNLSVLKTGKAKAIRFSTLERLCEVLQCQPGDILAWEAGNSAAGSIEDIAEDVAEDSADGAAEKDS